MTSLKNVLKPFVDWRSRDFQEGFFVKVPQILIDLGCRSSSSNCPIALAVALKFGGLDRTKVEVGDDLVRVSYVGADGESYNLDAYMSRSAMRFIRNFDQGKPQKEFRFKLFPANVWSLKTGRLRF